MDPCEVSICLKYPVLDNKGWLAAVSVLAVLVPLFVAFMCIIYWRNKKHKDSKIKQLKKELAGKERDKKELEEKLAHKEQGKFTYHDIFFLT